MQHAATLGGKAHGSRVARPTLTASEGLLNSSSHPFFMSRTARSGWQWGRTISSTFSGVMSCGMDDSSTMVTFLERAWGQTGA